MKKFFAKKIFIGIICLISCNALSSENPDENASPAASTPDMWKKLGTVFDGVSVAMHGMVAPRRTAMKHLLLQSCVAPTEDYSELERYLSASVLHPLVTNKENQKIETRVFVSKNTCEKVDSLGSAGRVILYFGGNRDSLNTVSFVADNILESFDRLSLEVLVFNYRGVGLSQGKAYKWQNLVDDGIAVVEHIKKNYKNIESKNIILWGWSLGGAVATEVAAHFHKNKFPVKLISDRSFGNLECVARDQLKVVAPKSPGFVGPMGSVAMKMIGFDLDVTESYLSIDPNYRIHFYSPNDERIADQCSIQAAVRAKKIKKPTVTFTGYKLEKSGVPVDHYAEVLDCAIESEMGFHRAAQDIIEGFIVKNPYETPARGGQNDA